MAVLFIAPNVIGKNVSGPLFSIHHAVVLGQFEALMAFSFENIAQVHINATHGTTSLELTFCWLHFVMNPSSVKEDLAKKQCRVAFCRLQMR